jgi:hypothetical protein
MEFELENGESVEIFDGGLVRVRDKCIVYRIAVSNFDGANLKVISGGRSKVLTPDSHSAVIDLAIWGELFLEAEGTGSVAGTCEPLFGF